MKTLTLLLPGFQSHAHDDRSIQEQALRLLPDKMQNKTQVVSLAPQGYEYRLLEHLGAPGLNDFPFAAVTAKVDGLPGEQGYWLRLDPVEFVVDMTSVFCAGQARLGLTLDEAQALGDELRTLLAEEELELHIPHPYRWYLCSNSPIDLTSPPLSVVVENKVKPHWFSGESSSAWLALFTEIQMLMHSSIINSRRRAKGLSQIGGCWIWGAGLYPKPVADIPMRLVYSDSELTRGLCQWLGLVCMPADAALDGVLNSKLDSESVLIELSADQDSDALLSSIMNALQDGRITRCRIEMANQVAFALERHTFMSWLKKRLPF